MKGASVYTRRHMLLFVTSPGWLCTDAKSVTPRYKSFFSLNRIFYIYNMETSVIITPNPYGFGRNWSLLVKTPEHTKSFYLGQDVKFCSRVLGMTPRDVVEAIGTGEISEGQPGNKKLAEFICECLELNETNVMGLEPWSLSAE